MPYFNEERKTFEVDGKPVTISTISIDGGGDGISVLENASFCQPKRVVDADRLISLIDPNSKYLGRDIQKAILNLMDGIYTDIKPIGGFLG